MALHRPGSGPNVTHELFVNVLLVIHLKSSSTSVFKDLGDTRGGTRGPEGDREGMSEVQSYRVGFRVPSSLKEGVPTKGDDEGVPGGPPSWTATVLPVLTPVPGVRGPTVIC